MKKQSDKIGKVMDAVLNALNPKDEESIVGSDRIHWVRSGRLRDCVKGRVFCSASMISKAIEKLLGADLIESNGRTGQKLHYRYVDAARLREIKADRRDYKVAMESIERFNQICAAHGIELGEYSDFKLDVRGGKNLSKLVALMEKAVG